MKALKAIIGSLIFTVAAILVVDAQEQFTQTVAKDNKSCNATCSVIDIPELNGTQSPVIFLTPIGKTVDLNPHPVGAYYMYLKKWSILNLDGTPITDGAQYQVEYYAVPDATHFSFTVSSSVGMRQNGACIDHLGLNRSSSAQVQILPRSSPTRGAWFNSSGVTVEYDPTNLKWCVASLDGSPVKGDTVYNIAYSAGGAPSIAPSTTGSPVGTPVQIMPVSTLAPQLAPPSVIVRAEWPLPPLTISGYDGLPKIGYGHCIAMSQKFTDPAILLTDTVIITGQAGAGGEQLTWTGAVENGAIRIFACNDIENLIKVQGQQSNTSVEVTGKKVNILVLR
ncbi:MAG: DUF7452 domain-containing protein [Pyrinomonadaceae bacterium]